MSATNSDNNSDNGSGLIQRDRKRDGVRGGDNDNVRDSEE